MSQIRRLLPSLNTLVAFEAAVRCGTFARAAKELGVTSPAVSRTIGRLELHLGLQLFRRTPAGAVLTKDGNELFTGISQGFREIEQTLKRLKGNDRRRRRPIVLSVSAAFATHWFMPRLGEFESQFPQEEVHFQLINGPLEGPLEDSVDIAMRFDPDFDPRQKARVLMPELILPVRAPQFEGAALDADVPALTRVISLDEARSNRSSVFASDLKANGKDELFFSDYTLVVQAALVGQGTAIGWLNVVSHLLAKGSLVPAGQEITRTNRHCALVTHLRPGGDIAEEVCDWIVRQFHAEIVAIDGLYPNLRLGSSLITAPNEGRGKEFNTTGT